MKVPRAVRVVTDPVLERVRVPVLSGVNRGRWWSLVSAGGGYGTGRRAHVQMRLLAELMQPGDVVWDVGAHHGFVTLCAAARVGPHGVVQAFEPSSMNRALLQRHVRWNRLRNVAVHPYALSDFDGHACFGGAGTSRMFTLGGGAEPVPVRTAATLVEQGICPIPSFVKIDVEGAEADTVQGALPVLPRSARLLIAVHSREADDRCTALLRAAGFELIPSPALEECRRGRWQSDPDLFCVGPEYEGADRAVSLLKEARA